MLLSHRHTGLCVARFHRFSLQHHFQGYSIFFCCLISCYYENHLFEYSCTCYPVHTFEHFSSGRYVELELLGYSVCIFWTWQDHTTVSSQVAESPAVLPFQTWPFALLCWMYDGISVLLWLLTKLSSYLHTFWYVYVSSSLRCSIMSFAHFGDTIIKEIFFLFIFWTVLGLCCCMGFSLAAALGLLITVVSSLADHRL